MTLVQVLLLGHSLQVFASSSLRGAAPNQSEMSELSLHPMVHDPVNKSDAFYNIISCRFGVVCQGKWVSRNGLRECDALVCGGDSSAKLADTRDSKDTKDMEMTDMDMNSFSMKSLIVCRHGAYCPGGLHWARGGGLVCRGGLLCRPSPRMELEDVNGTELKWWGFSHWLCLKGYCGHKLQAKDEPNGTIQLVQSLAYDPVNNSDAVSNIISCRMGVVCDGTWVSKDGRRECDGALACASSVSRERSVSKDLEMYDQKLSSHSFKNFIVCRYGSYCPGGWSWVRGKRVCRGGISCFMTPVLLSLDNPETPNSTSLTRWWGFSHWICQTGRCRQEKPEKKP